jgi:hypothetical protein
MAKGRAEFAQGGNKRIKGVTRGLKGVMRAPCYPLPLNTTCIKQVRTSSTASSSRQGGSRWRIHLRPRQGIAHRFVSEFGEHAPKGTDARRERRAVVLDDGAKLLGGRGGFVVG